MVAFRSTQEKATSIEILRQFRDVILHFPIQSKIPPNQKHNKIYTKNSALKKKTMKATLKEKYIWIHFS